MYMYLICKTLKASKILNYLIKVSSGLSVLQIISYLLLYLCALYIRKCESLQAYTTLQTAYVSLTCNSSSIPCQVEAFHSTVPTVPSRIKSDLVFISYKAVPCQLACHAKCDSVLTDVSNRAGTFTSGRMTVRISKLAIREIFDQRFNRPARVHPQIRSVVSLFLVLSRSNVYHSRNLLTIVFGCCLPFILPIPRAQIVQFLSLCQLRWFVVMLCNFFCLVFCYDWDTQHGTGKNGNREILLFVTSRGDFSFARTLPVAGWINGQF